MDTQFTSIIEENLRRNHQSAIQERDRNSRQQNGRALSLLPTGIFPHHLNIDELRYFPRYLVVSTIVGDTPSLLPDHWHYWGWTFAFMDSPGLVKKSELEVFSDQGIRRYFRSAVPLFFKGHYNRMYRFERMGKYSKRAIDEFPSVNEALLLLVIALFPLLEGMTRRRFPTIVAPDGRLRDENYSQYQRRGRVYLDGGLELWRDETDNDCSQEALTMIDDISQLPKDLPDGIINIERITSQSNQYVDSESLFDVLRIQRNLHAHGEDQSHRLASLLLTLCCMMYWDDLLDDSYRRSQSSVLDWLKTRDISPTPSIERDIYYVPLTTHAE